jgi:hypothetical protein
MGGNTEPPYNRSAKSYLAKSRDAYASCLEGKNLLRPLLNALPHRGALLTLNRWTGVRVNF